MPQVKALEILDIDGQKHLVSDMSAEVQQLVEIYNEWNQDFAEAKKTAAQLQAAVQMTHNQLSHQIQEERKAALEAQAAAEEAQAEADVAGEATETTLG